MNHQPAKKKKLPQNEAVSAKAMSEDEAELAGLVIGWAKAHSIPTPWEIQIKYREPGQQWIIEEEGEE